VPALRAAFQAAMSGVPGPVYVGLPLDVLYSPSELISMGTGDLERVRRKEVQGKAQIKV